MPVFLLIGLLALYPAAAAAVDLLRQGEQAMQEGDRATARRLFQQAADAGDPVGAFGLGVLHFQAGGDDELQASVRWFRVAAEQGHAPAQFNLGNAYLNGQGVSRDLEAAERWWRKAAHAGMPEARFNLGTLLLSGGGSGERREQAIAWTRAAAEQGFPQAHQRLEQLGEPSDYRDIKPDPAREPARSEARIMTLDPNGVTIQLFSGRLPESVERFMAESGLTGHSLPFRFLRDGEQWTAVVHGWYPNPQQARAAVERLKDGFKGPEPWVRPVKGVQEAIREMRRKVRFDD